MPKIVQENEITSYILYDNCEEYIYVGGYDPRYAGTLFIDTELTQCCQGQILDRIPTTSTPTCTPSNTPTISRTPPATPTATLTPSISASVTPTPSITPTITPTITLTSSITPTISQSVSLTPSITPTISVTPTITPTLSLSLSNTPTITQSVSVTPTITHSQTSTPTQTPTPTATPSNTPTASPTPSPSATAITDLPFGVERILLSDISGNPYEISSIDYGIPTNEALPNNNTVLASCVPLNDYSHKFDDSTPGENTGIATPAVIFPENDTINGVQGIFVTYNRILDTGAYSVTGYIIQYKDVTNDGPWLYAGTHVKQGNALFFSNDPSEATFGYDYVRFYNGITYGFRVAAVTNIGLSPWRSSGDPTMPFVTYSGPDHPDPFVPPDSTRNTNILISTDNYFSSYTRIDKVNLINNDNSIYTGNKYSTSRISSVHYNRSLNRWFLGGQHSDSEPPIFLHGYSNGDIESFYVSGNKNNIDIGQGEQFNLNCGPTKIYSFDNLVYLADPYHLLTYITTDKTTDKLYYDFKSLEFTCDSDINSSGCGIDWSSVSPNLTNLYRHLATIKGYGSTNSTRFKILHNPPENHNISKGFEDYDCTGNGLVNNEKGYYLQSYILGYTVSVISSSFSGANSHSQIKIDFTENGQPKDVSFNINGDVLLLQNGVPIDSDMGNNWNMTGTGSSYTISAQDSIYNAAIGSKYNDGGCILRIIMDVSGVNT